jgi:hypothetical protein
MIGTPLRHRPGYDEPTVVIEREQRAAKLARLKDELV